MLVKNNILEAFVGLLHKFKTRNCSYIQRLFILCTYMWKKYIICINTFAASYLNTQGLNNSCLKSRQRRP